MTTCELIYHYPVLYHVCSSAAWDNIKRHGLLSTEAILDLLNISGLQRECILSARRPESIILSDEKAGTFQVRDQKPLSDKKVTKGLIRGGGDCAPKEWYELLNRKVYFWATSERLLSLLNGRAYKGTKQLIIEIDTASLVNKYESQITLCYKNAGAMRAIHPIGPHVYETIAAFDQGLKRNGKPSRPVVELTVEYSVPDIKQFVLNTHYWH